MGPGGYKKMGPGVPGDQGQDLWPACTGNGCASIAPEAPKRSTANNFKLQERLIKQIPLHQTSVRGTLWCL